MCLPNSMPFPVGAKDSSSVNPIPNKLLHRNFHDEMKLIVQHVRDSRTPRKGSVLRRNKGAIFFGPSGSGKSWAAMALLMDELRSAEESGRTVVYFDGTTKSAYIFGKERCVRIREVFHGLTATAIPELDDETTLLIYDASAGSKEDVAIFPCEYIIYASPDAGGIRQAG